MKPPIRIVLDTNVLVSGLLNRASLPGSILNYIVAGVLTTVMEPRLMDEYQRVLARPRLHIPVAEAGQILLFIATHGDWIIPLPLMPEPGFIPDPSDLPFAEAAVTGCVQALVTGNPRHFSFLAAYDIQVFTPTEFLDWLNLTLQNSHRL